MISAAVVSSLRALRIRPLGCSGIVVGIALDEWHDGDAGLEPRESEREVREQHQRDANHPRPAAVLGERQRPPRGQRLGMLPEMVQAPRDDDHVQQQVDRDDGNGETHRLTESLEEDRAEPGEQDEREQDRVVEAVRRQRVLDDVRRRVRRGQRDRDDEARRREAEQAQDQGLASPARQQLFEQRDAALPVRAELGDAAVHWQRAEQRQEYEDERRERRDDAGGEERDAWLVPERREVVDAGEAHYFPPGRLVWVPGVWSLRLAKTLEEPGPEPVTLPFCQPKGHEWIRFPLVPPRAQGRRRWPPRTRLPTWQ